MFHINTCSLDKNFDDLQHLLICTKKFFDIIAISETKILTYVFAARVFLMLFIYLLTYSFAFHLIWGFYPCIRAKCIHIVIYKCCIRETTYTLNYLHEMLTIKSFFCDLVETYQTIKGPMRNLNSKLSIFALDQTKCALEK